MNEKIKIPDNKKTKELQMPDGTLPVENAKILNNPSEAKKLLNEKREEFEEQAKNTLKNVGEGPNGDAKKEK